MNAQHVLLHLNLIDGIGPVTIAHIYDFFIKNKCSFADAYRYSFDDWRLLGLTGHLSTLLLKGLASHTLLDQELALIQRHGIIVTTLADKSYPELLRDCYAPAPVLYWLGKIPQDSCLKLAIIGSRRGTNYARSFIDKVMPALAGAKLVLISGGAIGVDTMAHTAALEHGAVTVSILGSGLLDLYPARNKQLFEKIIKQDGALVSPFALRTSPLAGNFPARNRIIAAMSTGVLVVQASKKSGTSSTVQYALDYGRQVLAVPGPYDDELSAGCNSLLAQGAHVVTCASEILEIFGFRTPACKPASVIVKVPANDSAAEAIIQFCQQARSFDEISECIGISAEQIRSKLFQLQLDGYIEQNFAGLFKSTN